MSNNIITKLRDDSNYYGEFGNQYLSNSDIIQLLNYKFKEESNIINMPDRSKKDESLEK